MQRKYIYEYDSIGRLVRYRENDSTGKPVVKVANYFDDIGIASGTNYAFADGTENKYKISYKTGSSLVEDVTVFNDLLNINKLSGVNKIAADIDEDDEISTNDYISFKKHMLGISDINDYSKKKIY